MYFIFLLIHQATVYVSDKAMEILIIGAERMNRAMQDDVVAVELLPESDWRRPGASDASEADDDEATPTEADMPTGLAPALDDPIEVRPACAQSAVPVFVWLIRARL